MKKAFAEGKSLFRTEARKIFLDKKAMVLYNILCVNRDVAQFGRVLRSGHCDNQFIRKTPNPHKPFNTVTYGDQENKIHVVKSVLTTCDPTDTGI